MWYWLHKTTDVVKWQNCTHTLYQHQFPSFDIVLCIQNRFNCVWLFATLRTVAHQAPLFMGFSRQEYWSGLSCPPPGDLPDPGSKPACLTSPAGGFVTTSAAWRRSLYHSYMKYDHLGNWTQQDFSVLSLQLLMNLQTFQNEVFLSHVSWKS